jgi:hypothetical protein
MMQEESNSGASLEIFEENGEYYVRKSINIDKERGYKAIKKQQEFRPLYTSDFKIVSVPITSILEQGFTLFFTMPYVDGIGGEQIAVKGSSVFAEQLRSTLEYYLTWSLSHAVECIYPIESVHSKMDKISERVSDRLELFPMLVKQIELFRKYCDSDLTVPIGTCHGDLTLSNMKITPYGELYLFDFLDCEINSPLQDAAKLIQDLRYGWSFRNERESIRLKAEIFGRHVCPPAINKFEMKYSYEMKVIEVLTILRIAPYIMKGDTNTITWFNESIKNAIGKIKDMSCTH